MKTSSMLLALVTSLLTGCVVEHTSDFAPIENGSGFGFVTHVRGFTDPSLSAGLLYQDSSGKRTMVWSHLELIDGNPAVTNNIALLVGGRTELYDDGVERFRQRLIAFKAPAGPPLDITDLVLKKYCVESGVDFTNIVKDSFISLVRINDTLLIPFGIIVRGERGPGWISNHGVTLTISWHDIETIMADVKKTGKLKKEKQSGVEYLQKE